LIEHLKNYYGIVTGIIGLVVGWLVFPLSAKVDDNTKQIQSLRTKTAVQETKLSDMDDKLDDIKASLDKLVDKIYE
tara:strand:- start:409 stop:636 length:228 start_codon:yes stop_codon:yes gene_type:complete